ncbi:MAG: 4-hydroxy-3-methylbut-2-enyl diphosphate reductase [Bacteroidia bacterium]|nr:4-hydroxy-3-methylbut-2-enyl diphosphate reductase [Bacteroidia bacterium]
MKEFISRPLKKSYNLGQYAPLYRSAIIGLIKNARQADRDYTPLMLDFGPVRFRIARHFGFCKGVENAIEMAYEALAQNEGKRVLMISELIHNDFVNEDLFRRGLRFIKTASGKQLIPWEDVGTEDIVVVPAFGATVHDKQLLKEKGVDIKKWDAMCRFVEHVWFRSEELGKKGYSIIVHGKFNHEETQATFSYSAQYAPTLVIRDKKEAEILGEIILNKRPYSDFEIYFREKCTPGFNPEQDLEKIAVVNQTTMLAGETLEIAQFIKSILTEKYGNEAIESHFGNTRDTLCYATKNNQTSTQFLLEAPADLAIVIGGRNSSNTSHLVEMCEEKLPTYFIRSEEDILSSHEILHFHYNTKTESTTSDFIPEKNPVDVILTSGASCPDTLLEKVMTRILSFYTNTKSIETVLKETIDL